MRKRRTSVPRHRPINRNMARSYNRTVAGGRHVIDFKVGQSFGEPQLYPSLLPSSGDPARDITIYNAATGEYALRVGLIWWALGMGLAFGYFVFVYRMFRGKVRPEEGHGY